MRVIAYLDEAESVLFRTNSDESQGYRDWQRLVVFGTTMTVQFLAKGKMPQRQKQIEFSERGKTICVLVGAVALLIVSLE